MWRFFFNDTATTEIYTLSLHDALPIYCMENIFCNSAFLQFCKLQLSRQICQTEPFCSIKAEPVTCILITLHIYLCKMSYTCWFKAKILVWSYNVAVLAYSLGPKTLYCIPLLFRHYKVVVQIQHQAISSVLLSFYQVLQCPSTDSKNWVTFTVVWGGTCYKS